MRAFYFRASKKSNNLSPFNFRAPTQIHSTSKFRPCQNFIENSICLCTNLMLLSFNEFTAFKVKYRLWTIVCDTPPFNIRTSHSAVKLSLHSNFRVRLLREFIRL